MHQTTLPKAHAIPRWLLFTFIATSIAFTTESFSSDIKNQGDDTGSYSKVYWVKADPKNADGIFEYFDSILTPEARQSEHHAELIYQMIATGPGEWLLVANYNSQESAEAAVPWVGKIVGPLVKEYGMTLEPITDGEIFRLVRKN